MKIFENVIGAIVLLVVACLTFGFILATISFFSQLFSLLFLCIILMFSGFVGWLAFKKVVSLIR